MNNSDMPAMPVPINPGEVAANGMNLDGLTKREYFAGLAMQGLIASFGQHDVTDSSEVAIDAALFADALLAELERTK